MKTLIEFIAEMYYDSFENESGGTRNHIYKNPQIREYHICIADGATADYAVKALLDMNSGDLYIFNPEGEHTDAKNTIGRSKVLLPLYVDSENKLVSVVFWNVKYCTNGRYSKADFTEICKLLKGNINIIRLVGSKMEFDTA